MSHVHEGPLATYNSLTDPNLSGYFGNTRMRRHLRKSGLVNRQGYIISENQYRINMARKEHKKHVKDLLAQAIVHKTLDLERYRQVEIKKKLEEIAKIELVRRVRTTRGRKGDEEVLPYLTPRSQSRPQSERPSESSSTRKRPKSAPAPPRHRTHSKSGYNESYEDVIYVDGDGRPVSPPPASDRSRQSGKDVNEPIDTRHLYALDSEALQQYALKLSKMQKSRDGAMSPYLLSQIPKPPKKERVQSGRSPRRSARMSAKPDGPSKERRSGRVRSEEDLDHMEGALMLHRQEPAMMHQGEVQTLCEITMKYHGPNLTLPRDQFDPTQEVCIEQQHCGGNTLSVFKERLQAGSSFAFISRRHRGYPFSLTLYIDGRVDCRVSTCCEYKHGVGVKLGGKMGHFSLTGITGATPCYKCKLSVQAPPRSLKLKKSPKLKKKREPPSEEVTVEGTPRTPVTEKEPEISGKSDDDYEDDFEDEGNKYEEDFETEEEDRRQIIGLRDDETRENGKTVVVDVKEKEKEEEREGTLPPHRRIEGYSSEDEDQDSARFNAIKIKADIHSETKEEPTRKRASSTSSSSSSNSTPRAKTLAQEEPKKVALVRTEEEPMRSDRTDHSTTSTTSGDLTTATESTVEADTKRPASTSATKKARRRSSSSSSSSTTSSSDSEDERFTRKKREEKKKQEEEKKRREDEERETERRRKTEEDEKKRKEQEERDTERRRKFEEEELIKKREEEERRQKMEQERQQRNARMKEIEEERRRRDTEQQRKKVEEEKRKEEERQKRANEEERIKKEYERQLSQIKFQRESSSNLLVPALEENEDKTKTTETKVAVHESSSSNDSSSEDEEKKVKKPETAELPVAPPTPAPKKESSSSSSSSSSDTTSGSESEREKEKPKPAPMKPIQEESDKKRKSSTSSTGSSSSSSSNGEYTVQETQKKEEEKKIQAVPPIATKKSRPSSSSSSSDSESEEGNKEVKTPPSIANEAAKPEVLKDTKSAPVVEAKKKSSSGSSSGSSSSGSSSIESEAEPPSPKEPEKKDQLPPDLQAGLKRNEEPIKELTLHQEKKEEKKEEKKNASESEDSSSDSSSSDSSDSSDSETETDEKGKPQKIAAKSTDSEGEAMHGGNDPDNVARDKEESLESMPRVRVAQAHYGSILPMVENESSMELSGVKLDENQIAELSNHLGQRSDIVELTLRNCALDDDNFQNMALALRTSPSHPKIINLSSNKLSRRSISALASTIKEKPTVEILILNSNPVENVGCKILIDAILKAKDPFPFLRQSSGYLTPSEARDQESQGKDVYEADKQADSIIKELDLGQTGLSDAGIMEISRLLINNKTLTSLNMSGNTDITSAGWERLGQALQKNSTLKTLSLDFTNMGDEGIENLVRGLRFNTSLKCLDVASCGLTERGGKALQMLVKENTSITELAIQPGNNISDAVNEEICQFLALNKC